MGWYIVRRLLQSLIVLFGVTILSFGLLFLSGDPAVLLLGETANRMSVEEVEAFRHRMGFDRPWIVQYGDYIAGAVQGDLGTSYYYKQACTDMIAEVFPNTVKLAVAAFSLTVCISVPLGMISAVKRGSFFDRGVMTFALLCQSLPAFWLGILLMLVFGVFLKVLPISGMDTWQHYIMPMVTLGLFSCARNARLIRSYMLEVIGQDYIRTAESKGVKRSTVIIKHALKNALIPIVTMLGSEFAYLLGGSVITETIFAWPGMGRLLVNAINFKDIPMVQAGLIFIATIFVLVNLLVDLSYGLIDPRARVQ